MASFPYSPYTFSAKRVLCFCPMKHTLLTLSCLLAFLFPVTSGVAQEPDLAEDPVIIPVEPTVSIMAPEAVEVGKKIIFDATITTIEEDAAQFAWELGDGNTTREGAEIVHTYSETGEFLVRLTIRSGEQEYTAEKNVFVYDATAVIITTEDIIEETPAIREQAKENGVFLKLIAIEEETSPIIQEENLIQEMQEEVEGIENANIILFWTPSTLAVQTFTRFWQNLEAEDRFSLNEKVLIRITENSMSVAAATLQQSFEILMPPSFLLTRPEALNPIFFQKEREGISEMLQVRGIEFQVIDENSRPSLFLVLTRIITGFLAEGIPASTIFLILSFPFIAFIVAFSRQVIGLSTYGVYFPIMLALSFQILTLSFALFVLVVIVFLSFFLRILFTKLDILFIPRAALMLSAIALSLLSVIWFAIRFSSPVSISLAIFPMLVMSTLSEKFLSAQSEEGLKGALFGVLETILVATIAFILTDISFFKELLLSLPEIIVLPLIGIFLLGKFTGLRLSEYFRFRALLHEGMEE